MLDLATLAGPENRFTSRGPSRAQCFTAPPSNTTPPTISGPSPAYVGDTLTTGAGSWFSCNEAISAFYYQWLRNGVAIPGATGSAYTIQAGNADVGATIRSSVQACNLEGCSSYVQSSNAIVPANQPPDLPSNLSPSDG